MARSFLAGFVMLLPFVSAMPCFCAPEAAVKSKSKGCCCHEESRQESKPAKPTQCCCILKAQSDYTIETSDLCVQNQGLCVDTEPELAPPILSGYHHNETRRLDTGPPDSSIHITISVFKL